jgi:hypothetical protein
MDISRSLLAPIAIQDRQNRLVSVDLAGLITRLLLFDTYILQSIWLEDLILLQHSFSTAGLAQLFESGALKFQCAPFTFGETGQLVYTEQSKSLPLFNYEFSVIRVQGGEEKIERTLAGFDAGLRTELVAARIPVPEDYSKTVFQAWYQDLMSELLNSALKIELRRRGIIPVAHHLHLVQKQDDKFAVETDLPRRYRLPDIEAHHIVGTAMMALGRMHDQIGSMQTYSAFTALNENDKVFLDAKLGAISRLLNLNSNEQAFSRVIALKGLPVPEYGSTIVDVKKLLKLKESDECRAFKDWLSRSEALTDKEARERVAGLGKSIRQAFHSKTGKAVRFVVSNAVGLASAPFGIAAGLALSAADSFLIDRFFPKDSVISFLTEGYPSIFKQP